MIAKIITGGNKEKREKKIQKILKKLRVGRFDCYFLEGENSIGINRVRDFRKWAYFKPVSEKKAGIIKEAEKLTYEAMTALLKILEEPPRKLIMILETEKSEQLLATIISRCELIELSYSEEKKVFTDSRLKKDLFIILFGKTGEKFKLAEELNLKKEKLRPYIAEIIFLARGIIVSYYKGRKNKYLQDLEKECQKKEIDLEKKVIELVKWVEKLTEISYLFSRNINLRLLIENCLINS